MLEDRLRAAQELVAAEPHSPDAQFALASALHLLDFYKPNGGRRVPEAEAAYRKTIELAPNLAVVSNAYSNLGALLLSAGRIDAAVEAIDAGMSLGAEAGIDASAFSGSLFNQGKALGMRGNVGAAHEAYLAAIAAARGDAGASGTWAKSYASLGAWSPEQLADMAAAVAFLAGEAAEEGGSEEEDSAGGGAAGVAGQTRRRRRRARAKRSSTEAEWAWLRGMTPTDRSWLHFALYSAYNAQGDYDEAWAELDTANALQRTEAPRYDAARHVEVLAALRRVFGPPAPGDAAGATTQEALLGGAAGVRDATPIFVVGVPRSGSTLVEQILASHSAAFGAGAAPACLRPGRDAPRRRRTAGEDTAFAPLLPELMRALSEPSISFAGVRRVGEAYLAAMRARAPAMPRPQRIVDKMLRNAWNLGYVAMTLPDACIIHVVRHPMDTLHSCYAQPFEGRGTPWAWDVMDIAEEMRLTEEVMTLWRDTLPLRVLRVPYEALVAEQAATSRALLAHCGLDWEDGVLDFHSTQRTVQTASQAQVRRKMYSSSVGRWRLYEKQLAPVLERLRPMVEAYEAEVPASRAPSAQPHADEL